MNNQPVNAGSEKSSGPFSRRKFLTTAAHGAAFAALGRTVLAAPAPSASPKSGPPAGMPHAEFPKDMMAPSENPIAPAPNLYPPEKRVGFAIVGLGALSLAEIIPAFGQSKYAKLTALVSGHPEKAKAVAEQHGIAPKNIYSYETYDDLKNNPDVDVIYIVLPNSMHAEYTIRGAQAGKHILCEKPMATTAKDAEAMIEACKKANRHLMIGYRCQYEPHHLEMIRLARSKEMGAIKIMTGDNGHNMGNPSQWRLRKALSGGGPMPDVGIYCLNGFRFVTGEEPSEVTGLAVWNQTDIRFREVEESLIFTLKFPSGAMATATTSYAHHAVQRYRVMATDGWFEMDPAFPYQHLRLRQARKQGEQETIAERMFPTVNQFSRELDHMAQCVLTNQRPRTPGEEGLQDVRIMEAIYQSAAGGGAPIKLNAPVGLDVFRGPAPTFVD